MKDYIKNNLTIILSSLIILMLIILLVLLNNNKSTVIIEKNVTDENIVFFGDSITEQYDVEKYYDNFVVNNGISGDITDSLINRIEIDVYKYNPSKVFLLIGINDLRAGKGNDEILDNIEIIINGIKDNRPNATIYVQSIYPINRDIMNEYWVNMMNNITNSDIKKLNKKIEKLCKELDVQYINVYDKLVDEKGNLKKEYSKEGLHISDSGYQRITDILKKYLIQ